MIRKIFNKLFNKFFRKKQKIKVETLSIDRITKNGTLYGESILVKVIPLLQEEERLHNIMRWGHGEKNT